MTARRWTGGHAGPACHICVFPVGKISLTEAGTRFFAARIKTFCTRGGVQGIPAQRSRVTPERPSIQRLRRKLSLGLLAICVQFARRFAAVAAVAKALEVRAIAELLPISLVVGYVIHVRRTDASTVPGALTAERLAHELCRPQIKPPLVGLVHPPP